MHKPTPHTADRRRGIPQIYNQLRRALRYGTHPAQLAIHSKPVIDLLAPASDPETPIEERAVVAEQSLRAIIGSIGGRQAQALTIFFGLEPGYIKATVECRRKAAAHSLGIQPDTFRRPRHERTMLLGIAMEIYRRQQAVTPAKA